LLATDGEICVKQGKTNPLSGRVRPRHRWQNNIDFGDFSNYVLYGPFCSLFQFCVIDLGVFLVFNFLSCLL
jgi:hypothetical protein